VTGVQTCALPISVCAGCGKDPELGKHEQGNALVAGAEFLVVYQVIGCVSQVNGFRNVMEVFIMCFHRKLLNEYIAFSDFVSGMAV
jgi:hypothetical protein